MDKLVFMYVTLAPVIFAGVLNMVWCKLPILKKLAIPIDMKVNLKDGYRLFGDNKSWKGFLGYIILNSLCMILWGLLCSSSSYLFEHNFFYIYNQNTILFNTYAGFLLGFAYALFELPNSFIKRRIGINSGKSLDGKLKALFVFLDQADSIFGCVLVLWLFYSDMNILFYFLYVFVGAITHIILNIFLYLIHLRKNMF